MNYRLAAVMAVMGVSLGVGFLVFSGAAMNSSAQASELSNNQGAITGHVSLAIYDQLGNIKAYSQSDNTIVNSGKNCISQKLFAVDHGCSLNGSRQTNAIFNAALDTEYQDRFTIIAVGTGSTLPAASAHGTVTGLVATSATKTLSGGSLSQTSTGADPAAVASASVTDIVATFSNSGTNDITYTEAGLFNKNNVMFAYQDITDAILSDGDSLTVTWSITIG